MALGYLPVPVMERILRHVYDGREQLPSSLGAVLELRRISRAWDRYIRRTFYTTLTLDFSICARYRDSGFDRSGGNIPRIMDTVFSDVEFRISIRYVRLKATHIMGRFCVAKEGFRNWAAVLESIRRLCLLDIWRGQPSWPYESQRNFRLVGVDEHIAEWTDSVGAGRPDACAGLLLAMFDNLQCLDVVFWPEVSPTDPNRRIRFPDPNFVVRVMRGCANSQRRYNRQAGRLDVQPRGLLQQLKAVRLRPMEGCVLRPIHFIPFMLPRFVSTVVLSGRCDWVGGGGGLFWLGVRKMILVDAVLTPHSMRGLIAHCPFMVAMEISRGGRAIDQTRSGSGRAMRLLRDYLSAAAAVLRTARFPVFEGWVLDLSGMDSLVGVVIEVSSDWRVCELPVLPVGIRRITIVLRHRLGRVSSSAAGGTRESLGIGSLVGCGWLSSDLCNLEYVEVLTCRCSEPSRVGRVSVDLWARYLESTRHGYSVRFVHRETASGRGLCEVPC